MSKSPYTTHVETLAANRKFCILRRSLLLAGMVLAMLGR